ncbi:MAG: polysaccharide biosynthesis C-terminal domain-containing protein [Chitinophagaceae bacterium]|nr:polysaccharide biosynthesis C-terminal domain-containing protein [Chitinophagaceae bacterium]MCW5927393.1 polysaccharide biosynthesis C-terminal domain-containing protein [Chitinophagaceae bacterium]
MRFSLLVINYSFYKIANAVVSFFILVMMSRLMGAEGYGIFSLMLVNVGFFNLLSSMGAEAGIAYHSAAGFATDRILRMLWKIILFQTALIFLIEFFHFELFSVNWLLASDSFRIGLIGILYFVIASVNEKYICLLNGKQMFLSTAGLILFCNILLLLALLVVPLFFTGGMQTAVYYIAFVAAGFVQAVVLIIIGNSIRRNRLDDTPSGTDIKAGSFLSYSVITYFANLMQFAAYRIDIWAIHYFKGPETLGPYAVASRLLQFFWLLPGVIATTLLVKIANEKERFESRMLHAVLRVTNGINLFAATVLLVLANWFIPVVFGKNYSGAVLPFLILTPGYVMFCNTVILAAFFAAKNKLKVNFGGSMLCLLTGAVLNLLLVPRLGAMGAACGTSISFIITTVFFLVKYRREERLSWRQLIIPFKKDFLILKELSPYVYRKES